MKTTGGHPEGYVLLGKMVKPHGIRGELKLLAFTESPAHIQQYKQLYLSADEGQTLQSWELHKSRIQGKFVLCALKGCLDRNRAEELVGSGVWVKEEDMPTLEEDEFYLHSLEGKIALDGSGQHIGVIEAVLTGSGQDLLKIVEGDREYLVPLVADFLVSIIEEQVTLELPQGLLEVNR